MNGRVGLVLADNLGFGRFRNGNKEHVLKMDFVDGAAVVVGGVVAVDGVAVVGGAVDVADAVDVDAVVDDAVDFDDSSGKLVCYGDFGNSFDIDVPGGSYSLSAYDVLEQVRRWLYQGVGMLGGLGGWNSLLVGNFHGLDKHSGLYIFVLGQDFGAKGFGLDELLKGLDLIHKVCRDPNEPVVADDYLMVLLELLDEGEDID